MDKFLVLLSVGIVFAFTSQADAGFVIHVSGAVQSYENGIYRVKTRKKVLYVIESRLPSSSQEQINRRLGRRIQMGLPLNAILTAQEFANISKRRPASARKKRF